MLGPVSISLCMSLRMNPFQDWLFCLPCRCDQMTHKVKDLILHRILDLRSCNEIGCGSSGLPQLYAGISCGTFCFLAIEAVDPVRARELLPRPEEPRLTPAFISTPLSHPCGNVGSYRHLVPNNNKCLWIP